MGKVLVYIAVSLDGFIARPDDDISWLDPFSAGGEDYGYGDFLRTMGTAVMGSRTYGQSLAHPERLLTGLKNYILTSKPLVPAPGIRTEPWNGPPAGLVGKIREESADDIYLVGGGRAISRFLDEGLVDEIRLFVVPVILGTGIPLFTGLRHEVTLGLAGTKHFRTGIVQLTYIPGDRGS